MSLKLNLSKKEFKGPDDSIFIYQIPSKTKAIAIFMAGCVNGKPDPAIYDPEKIDPEKQLKYNYKLAKEFIVEWKNVVDEEENEIPFEKDYVEYIDIKTITEFVVEVAYPVLMIVIGVEKEEAAPLATSESI